MYLNAFKNPYLNLGCGIKIHPDWINIDSNPTSDNVLKYNLLKRLPIGDNSIKYIYHSHLLEHFSESDGNLFIKECYRLLEWDGIVRIVLPDLENIINCYVDLIKKRDHYDEMEFSKFHRWLIIELFDQAVREYPGGLMKESLKIKDPSLFDFISERIGPQGICEDQQASRRKPLLYRIKRKLVKVILNEDEIEALKIGLFRNNGEIHKWMYDKYSLSQLLFDTGFKMVEIKNPYSSNIPLWESYGFDVKSGKVLNPNSLYIEAVK